MVRARPVSLELAGILLAGFGRCGSRTRASTERCISGSDGPRSRHLLAQAVETLVKAAGVDFGLTLDNNHRYNQRTVALRLP
jgi:hypothetical protein